MVVAVATSEPRSLHIFPLHGIAYVDGRATCTCKLGAECDRVGKHPMVRWRTYDESTKGPSGGYGIQTGAFNGFFAIDLDVKPAKDGKPAKNGIEAFITLANGRPIYDTQSTVTPSGSVHLFYKQPENTYIPNSQGELGPGIDVKGDGGFVVGPGSPHALGGIYQEVPGPLADPPEWLLALVVKQPRAPEPLATAHRTVDPASPEGLRAAAWAREYLATRAEPAIEGQDGSGTCFAVCCHLMYSALPLDALRALVLEIYNPRCDPPWSEEEIDHKLTDADRRMDQPRGLCSPDFIDAMHRRTKDTEAKAPDPLHEYSFEPGMRGSGETRKASFYEIVEDLNDHVDWAGVLQFNTFRDRVVAVDPPMRLDAETPSGLSDNDVQLVRAWFEYNGKKINKDDVRAAVEAVGRQRPFHPIQDMLQYELVWDRRPRLDRVLPDYFNTPDGPYERAIGPRWFISLVARVMTPGCQSDCTLVLESAQGGRKTSTFRALMRDPTWYAESTCGVDSKDFYENLRGVWLMGFDELDSLSRASLTKVKTVLTATVDRYRKSYGHFAVDYLRACGFCGSTNLDQYLNDPTGGRRFWPVKVLRDIDVGRIARDRDQIWAEAYYRWRAGEAWHIDTPELRTLCEVEQDERLEVDSWEEAIRRWLNTPSKFSRTPVAVDPKSVFRGGAQAFDGSAGVTTADVLEHAIGKLKGQWTRGDTIRVGTILQHRLGMKRTKVRLGNIGKNDFEWRYLFPST